MKYSQISKEKVIVFSKSINFAIKKSPIGRFSAAVVAGVGLSWSNRAGDEWTAYYIIRCQSPMNSGAIPCGEATCQASAVDD